MPGRSLPQNCRIHPTAVVSPEAELAENVEIGPLAVIDGKVKFGPGCIVRPGAYLFGPVTLTDGPAAGQSINYFENPFGTNIELISYPHGMAYQSSAPIPLWDPRDNHPQSQPGPAS